MSSENSKNGYDNGEDKVSMNKDNIALRLDLGSGQKISVTVDGSPLNLVKYTVTYVADPIKMTNNDFAGNPIKDPYACHKMNIYVPETAAKNKAANIVLYVRNHGYLASELYNFTTGIVDGGKYFSNSSANEGAGAALAAGYVFCEVGTRGRNNYSANDLYAGKAPAMVVDAKAAIVICDITTTFFRAHPNASLLPAGVVVEPYRQLLEQAVTVRTISHISRKLERRALIHWETAH